MPMYKFEIQRNTYVNNNNLLYMYYNLTPTTQLRVSLSLNKVK